METFRGSIFFKPCPPPPPSAPLSTSVCPFPIKDRELFWRGHVEADFSLSYSDPPDRNKSLMQEIPNPLNPLGSFRLEFSRIQICLRKILFLGEADGAIHLMIQLVFLGQFNRFGLDLISRLTLKLNNEINEEELKRIHWSVGVYVKY